MRSKLLLSLSAVCLGLAALGTLACGDPQKGLSTATPQKGELTQAALGAPSAVEADPSETPYPLGLPSALKGKSIYQANCAQCHGTYYTGQERVDLDKESSKPAAEQLTLAGLKKEGREPGNPFEKAKVGPDFYSRDWRFQKRPGELFRMLAYGADSTGHQHPGPSGKMGEGWMNHVKDQRGSVAVAANDPAPIWNAVYYVWSRSIAGASPQRFKEVWDVYGQNCNVCHGTIGKGDGPLARTLNPMPFNFHNRKALAETTDEFLFWRISEGGQFHKIPDSILKTMSPQALSLYVHQWSAMPAWRGALTDEQRWMAVDGVRSKSYEHE